MHKSVLTRIPPNVVSLNDYETLAQERMPSDVWAWLNSGVADEVTLHDNVNAFQRISLQNRVLKSFQHAHTQLTLWGQTLDYPVLLAPIAYHQLLHPEGELATVAAANAMKTAMVVSTQASTLLEDIAKQSTSPLWFQLYFQAERAHTLQLVQRAEAAGYKALVMTVDAPVNGVRNREQRAGFALPAAIRAVNLQAFPAQFSQQAVPGESPLFGTSLLANVPMWEDVAWLCRATTLPVILKGILSPDDALQAIDVGAAGIIVSNHGGRVLDTVPATIEALPAVAAAINGQIPILLDGGIRRGTDVLKALALGANAVLVGRPYAHALAAAGALGVAHMLHVLRTEFEVAMALTGCATLQDITPHVIFRSR